jgi:hypothetical protein
MTTFGNTNTTGTEFGLVQNYVMVLYVSAPENGTVNELSVRIKTDDNTNQEFKVGIWNSSGTLLAVSDTITAYSDGGMPTSWYTKSISNTSITIGSYYYLGCISNRQGVGNYSRVIAKDTTGTDGGMVDMSFSSPTNFTPASLVNKGYDTIIYATYTTGSSLKIESITPSNLEGISWANITAVR